MQFFIKNLMLFWFLIAIALGWEFIALNWAIKYSLLNYLNLKFALEMNLSTDPGRPISYWFGWAGFGTMLITNFYIFRKRAQFMQKWGKARNWLEFHIFCGLLGPTFIIFHTNFKIGGLVAISFWSMAIVAGSGIFGRYFYVQAARGSKSLREEALKYSEFLDKLISKGSFKPSAEDVERMKNNALLFVGANIKEQSSTVATLVINSFIGDIRLLFGNPKVMAGLDPRFSDVLCDYAVVVRQEKNLAQFERLLGYWHTFHVPFTVTMYITAIIHIVVAEMFLT